MIRSSESQVYYKKAVLKSFKNFTDKNLCKSLFLNKVADVRPGILFRKRLLQRCFPVSFTKYSRAPFLQITSGWLLLQNILLLVTSTSATKCYHWPCFFRFTLNIFRANTSFFWKSWTASYGWTDLLLIKQMIHWKYYKKSEAVAQQCSVKMTFYKTSQFSKKNICDGVPFRKTVSPHVWNFTEKDVFTGVFLWIDFANTIFFWFISFKHPFGYVL